MGIDFVPQNALEEAIHEQDASKLMQAIAEEESLTRLISVSCLAPECFTDEMIFSVIFLSIPLGLRKKMNSGWFYGHLHAGERIKSLVKEALSPLPDAPSPGEKALIKAILNLDNGEIIRLIREDGVKFQGFAPHLLVPLPNLSQTAALAFLRDGLSQKLKAIVLGILLKEVETPSLLKEYPVKERIRFANLMLHIVSGEDVRDDLPWFPDCKQFPFAYYFDPEHKYRPEES